MKAGASLFHRFHIFVHASGSIRVEQALCDYVLTAEWDEGKCLMGGLGLKNPRMSKLTSSDDSHTLYQDERANPVIFLDIMFA